MNDAEAAAEYSGPARPDPVLYPDIASAGSLQHALQTEFDRADQRLSGYPNALRAGAIWEPESKIHNATPTS